MVAAIERDELLTLLSGLSARERAILRAHFGLDGEEQSLRRIAAGLGVSVEPVRQLEQRALGKLGAAATTSRGGGNAPAPTTRDTSARWTSCF